MTDQQPDDRAVSPAAGPRRLFQSPHARKIGFGAAGLVAFGSVVFFVHAISSDKGIERPPADIGATAISQVVRQPPAPAVDDPVEKPKDPEPQVVRVLMTGPPPPPSKQEAPPRVVAASPAFVQFPADSGETHFDVPTREGKADDGDARGKAPESTRVGWKASVLPGGKAGPAIDLTYMMMPQRIPCVLDTAMDSTIAGDFACHTAQDVLSPGRVPLMIAGTTIQGTFKNDIKVGQQRIPATAVTAWTPEGIPVPLDSQMGDGMGRTGINGEVENWYLEKFGAAIGLTVAQSALGFARELATRGGNSYLQFNSGGGNSAPDIATEILRRQAEIQPTIYVPAGQTITVILNHPVDFSDAIRVRTRQ